MILRTINTLVLLAIATVATAQSTYRSEGAHYDTRKDADALTRTSKKHYIEFSPAASRAEYDRLSFEQTIQTDQSWVDASSYIHIENAGGAYDVVVNGSTISSQEDSITPSDIEISKFLRGGDNSVEVVVRPSKLPALEQGVTLAKRPRFEGSYIYNQNKLSIEDYIIEVVESEESAEHGRVNIAIIAKNRYNYPETIDVGYDVYDPAGKLVEFDTQSATIEGGGSDTIRFSPYIYGASKYRWDPAKGQMIWSRGKQVKRYSDQSLYSVMLFTRKGRVSQEYTPLKTAFSPRDYRDGALYEAGKKIELKATKYNASATEKSTKSELAELKTKGFNTITPDYPQPLWFYSLCDKLGLYVVDQVAINSPLNSDNKGIGGTPSNDPKLLEEYISRTKRAYYRTRNFTSIIAYSLGGNSGNGYNMYKTYQWLKSVEGTRPVIYQGAAGEWNSDSLEIN